MSTDIAARENGTLVAERPSSGLALSFGEMTMRVAQLDQFYREVMQEGTDFGKIPDTDKPTLYQPGAQMLDQIFGYVPTFEVTASSTIDWHRPIPFFHYIVVCRLVSRRSGEVVAEGIGSCNSHEDKYRWRNAKRVCPDCKLETIIKGKQEWGGGWLCFKKSGGCGSKYRDGEAIIEDQVVGRVENEDTASLENTVSKMAQKRAHIAATLNATGASRIFTQDIEDLPQFQQALTIESTSRTAGPTVGDIVAAHASARQVVVDGKTVKSNAPPSDEPPVRPDDDIDAQLADATRKSMGRDPRPVIPTTTAPLKQSRVAMVKSLGFRLAHARRLGLDPADITADDLTDDELAETLTALTAQITTA